MNHISSRTFFAAACLVMLVFALAGINAADTSKSLDYLPTEDPVPDTVVKEIGYGDISTKTAGYTPHSGIYRASAGTIASDTDVFMSVFDFNAVKMQNWFAFTGFDEHGVNLGYALKFGSAYLGFSYGGTLIDRLAQRIINPDIFAHPEEKAIKENIEGTASPNPGTDGNIRTEDTIGVLLGLGVFGVKLEFASYKESEERYPRDQKPNYSHILESSLKPSLELGWNIPIASVQAKFALRAAYDLHKYVFNTGDLFYYFDPDPDPDNPPDYNLRSKFLDKVIYRDFTEPSAGLTLGFDFDLGENTRATLDLAADAALRWYSFEEHDSGEKEGIKTVWKIWDDPLDKETFNQIEFEAPKIDDMRFQANPAFSLVSKFSELFTAGAMFKVNVKYDIFTITYKKDFYDLTWDTTANSGKGEYVDANPSQISNIDTDSWYFSLTPELSVGVRFTPWPDHFSLQAGMGMDLFSFNKNELTRVEGSDSYSEVGEEFVPPAVKITAGLTMNITPDMALDLLALTSGLDISATKITLLLTFSK